MILKQIEIFMWIALMSVAILSCGQNLNKKEAQSLNQSQQTVEMISPTDLNAKLGDIQLIDVRTPSEFKNGYIKGAKNINYFDGDFIEQMSSFDKSKPVYLYCRSDRRSGSAASKLEKAGFTKIYDLKGGILAWSKEKLQIEK